MRSDLFNFTLLLHIFLATLVESCLVIEPYCNCMNEVNINSIKNLDKLNNHTSNEGKLNNSNQLKDHLNISCMEIANSTLFLNNLSIKLKSLNRPYNLKVVLTKHEIIEQILNNLTFNSKSNLRINLNGLVLSNLTDIKENTFNFDLNNFLRLNYLEFTSNQIDYLNCSRFSSNLRQIDLSKNHLKSIFGCNLIGDFVNLTQLDLSKNLLKFMDFKRIDKLRSTQLNVSLSSNDWDCNKNLIPLINLVDLSVNSNQNLTKNLLKKFTKIIFSDHNQSKCSSPKNLINLTLKQAAEIYNTEVCSTCNCYVVRGTLKGLNCENRNLTKLPRKIPSNTKVVFLDYNSITKLNFRNSNEEERESWKSVLKLSISHNKISSLEGLDFNALESVRLLNFTHNRLTSIPLEFLNKLTIRFEIIKLGFNPWKCDCDTKAFQRWLRSKKGVDIENVKCDNETEGQPIYKLDPTELCNKTNHNFYWVLGNIILSVLITLLIIKLLYDYLWKLKTGKLPYFFKLNC